MTELAANHPWQGLTVATRSGEAVGQVKDVWLSPLDHRPEWLVLGGGPAGRGRWIPVEGTTQAGDILQTGFAVDQIKAAPKPTPRRGEIDPGDMGPLRLHYGLKPRRGAAKDRPAGGSGAAEGPVAADQSDEAMTRSEEQLRLRRSVRPRERVRLVKRVVVEDVQLPVRLRREELVLEREPFGPGMEPEMEVDGELRDGQEMVGEVVLYEEQPILTKRIVPKERVRLVKTTATEEHHVEEQVRKEQIRAEREPRRGL